MKKFTGFSLIELMIVIAVIAILAVVATPAYKTFLLKAKRAEAHANLHSLYVAEQAYFADHNEYTAQLKDLGWEPSSKNMYTYGFSGGAGSNVMGSLKTPLSAQTSAGKDKFVAAAAGDIDGDGTADVLTVDDKGAITLVTDDIK